MPVSAPSSTRSAAVFLFVFSLERNSLYVMRNFNCINVVVNLRSAIMFYFPDCCSECSSVFTLYVFFNRDFVGGLLDVV